MDFVFKNAKIVTSTGIVEGDLGIKSGKIEKIGRITEKAGGERDCTGLFILPGLIDMHVHFRDPGFPDKEDFFTGSQAAAAGGVTTILDMPNTNPPTLTVEALEQKRAIASAKSIVNFGLYMGLSIDNLEEIKAAKNIAGVKIYMGSSTGNLLCEDANIIEKVFGLGKFAVIHAEKESIINENKEKYKDSSDVSVHSLIRSPQAAYEAIKEALHLAKKHNGRAHIAHVSTKGEVEELRKFLSPKISAEVAPHHLYLTQSAYAERGNFVKVNPPIRTEKDRQTLWKALKEGVIQVIATDHAPHTKAEKERPYNEAPSGMPGVETVLPLLLESVNHGELNLEEVAKYTSVNPAALLGMKTKGRLEAGYDADLVIVDMNKKMEVGERGYFTKCGWSPFSGRKLLGWPVTTVVNGEIVFDNGKIVSDKKGREIRFS